MAIQDAIGRMKTKIANITGIKGADEYLPEALPTTENWVVIYPGSTTFIGGQPAGCMTSLYSVVIEIHTPRNNLPQAIKKVMPYYDDIPNALFDELFDTKFTSTVDTFESIDCTGLISMSYAGVETVGFRYTVKNVKIITTVS